MLGWLRGFVNSVVMITIFVYMVMLVCAGLVTLCFAGSVTLVGGFMGFVVSCIGLWVVAWVFGLV